MPNSQEAKGLNGYSGKGPNSENTYEDFQHTDSINTQTINSNIEEEIIPIGEFEWKDYSVKIGFPAFYYDFEREESIPEIAVRFNPEDKSGYYLWVEPERKDVKVGERGEFLCKMIFEKRVKEKGEILWEGTCKKNYKGNSHFIDIEIILEGENIEVKVEGASFIEIKDREIENGKIALTGRPKIPSSAMEHHCHYGGVKIKRKALEKEEVKEDSFGYLGDNRVWEGRRNSCPSIESSFEIYEFVNSYFLSPTPDPIYQTATSLPPSEQGITPYLCRFLIVDPAPGFIADTRTLNPYIYAADNPLVYIDRDGEGVVIVAAAIGARLGGLINGTAEALYEYTANPNASFGDLAKAFGVGFAGGAVGTLVGLAVEAWVKNPMIAVPVGQGFQSAVTQGIEEGTVNVQKIIEEIISGLLAGKIVKTVGPRAPGRPIDVFKPRKFRNTKELFEFTQKPGARLHLRKVGFEIFLTSLPYKDELHRDWNRFLWHVRTWQAMKKPPRPKVTVEWEYYWDKMLSYGRANPVPPSQKR